METPFYHDDTFDHPDFLQPPHYGRAPSLKAVSKTTMAQNYPGTVGHAPGMKLLQGQSGSTCGANSNNLGLNGNTNAPLMAPSDMNHLKMAAPDLEHLIIHSGQGLVTTSPATGTTGSPFLYRNQVTNEQEGFADGFVKALADLHKQNQLIGSPVSPPSSIQGAYQRNVTPGGGEMPVYTNLCSYNPSQIPGSASYPEGQTPFTAGAGQSRGPDEPQTVPEVPHPPQEPTGSPPSLSPIDLESQEQIKAERKRLRNRIAASKCRKRKLERISRLEEKVKVLKTQNSDLASTAGVLRQQVAQLKHKVMSHVTNGCQIALSSVALPKSGQSSSC